MSVLQVIVSIFAIVSVSVSVLAIWFIAKASGVKYKALWILGSLFGFIGFAINWSSPGDLYLQFGLQIPVVMVLKLGGGDIILKTLFPFVAVVALVKFHSAESHPNE